MRLLIRILVWIAGGLAALSAAALALGYYLVARSLPNYDATHSVAGLEAPVEIVRDANAVPHIYAQSEVDAFFALGLVHAQERLWQMETTRRGAQGRLSELFGGATLPLDRRMRALDLYTHARAAVPGLSDATRAALDAYSAGVNAWIREVNEEALGRGAPEFFVFDEGIAPWTPADSVAILKVMALRLTGAAAHETRRAALLRNLSEAQIADLFPDYPDAGVIELPKFSDSRNGARAWRRADAAPQGAGDLARALADAPPEVARAGRRDEEPVQTDKAAAWLEAFFFPGPELAGASNAWAVDGRRTTTGASLMANDPHLWLSAPSVWMLVHLGHPSGGAIGGSVPGIPAVAVGRNGSLAWGLTTVGMDDQDIFIERVNPDDPNEYLTPSGWTPFIERVETIRVRGGASETTTFRATRHGPVMPPDLYRVGEVTPRGHVAALAWTALSPEDRGMDAILALMRATSIKEAVDAGAFLRAGAQNVTVASQNGVGMFVAGRAPKRRADSRSRGRIPSLGWLPENDWDGLADYEANPRSIRPESGVVANANNRTTNAAFPNHISFDWDAPYRIRRIEQKLNDREFHTIDSFIEVQNDTVSEMARAVLPLVARDLWWTRADDARAERRETALEMLAEWNGEMSQHAPEPLIFAAWMRALTRRIAGDELGALIEEVEGPRPLFVERVLYDVDGAGTWCDVDKTVRRETCADMAKLALEDALDELVESYGAELRSWRWGEAHIARHVATPLGLRWPFSLFLNIEHETSGGDYTLQRAKTPGRGPTPYANVHAGGYRAVYDFADLDRSVFIIATGQSGHPLSRHYDDMAETWRGGRYVPMSMAEEDARAGALGVMRLTPE